MFTESAMREPTPSQRKAESAARLAAEKERLAWLQEQCAESARLTEGMVDILESFEVRLGKLEETILPVYQETGNLQRRQENIDRTLSELDHVINYYNVSKEVEAVVREGPGTGLHAFLEAMAKLRGALDYFSSNNPGSLELENVRSLHSSGGGQLFREFSELLKKHSRPVGAIEILNSVLAAAADCSVSGSDSVSRASSSDECSIAQLPEEVHGSLVLVAEWLAANERDEYMNVYAVTRADVMRRSLEAVRDHQKTASTGSGGRAAGQLLLTPAKVASPAAASGLLPVSGDSGTPAISVRGLSSGGRRLQARLKGRMGAIGSRLEAATGVNIPKAGGRHRLLQVPGGAEEADAETELFLTTVSALQRLMASEQQLMGGVIPAMWQRRIFEIITRDSLDMVAREGEAITARVKRSIAGGDFVGVLTLFHLLRHMMALKPLFDKTLEGCDPAVKAKYGGVVEGLQRGGQTALDGFVEGIRADATTREKMPKDGTVFQLTSNILMYLEQLVDYMDTISDILSQDPYYNQTVLRLPKRVLPQDRPQAMLGLYFKKVIVQLNLTLVNKSETYPDPFLRAVFRLNNNM
jgi:exocyst complex protein 7